MASSNGAASDAESSPMHQLAIAVSRELNLVNPNDLLAKRVLELAQQNSESLPQFQKAAKTFGRFRDVFLQEVWMDSKSAKFTGAGAHDASAPSGMATSSSTDASEGRMTIGNLVIEDSEVMMPQKQAPGGLMRPSSASRAGLQQGAAGDKHVFKAPARSSELGLDRLAAEKRKERLASGEGSGGSSSGRDSKRSRYDSGPDEDSADSDTGVAFKSEPGPCPNDRVVCFY